MRVEDTVRSIQKQLSLGNNKVPMDYVNFIRNMEKSGFIKPKKQEPKDPLEGGLNQLKLYALTRPF